MNNLKSILKNYCRVLPSLNYSSLQSVTTNLQNAEPGQITFYRIKNGKEPEKVFKKRYFLGRSGLVIINRKISFNRASNLIVVENPFFLKLQRELVELLFPLDYSVKLIGITGTNGKTSTAWLVGQILKQYQFKGLILGTAGLLNQEGQVLEDLEMTTPSSLDLRRIIHKFQGEIDFISLEVSSHALDQDRLDTIKFDSAGWTNFSQDHLDYHFSMEEYFKTKSLLRNYLKDKVSFFVPCDQKSLIKQLRELNISHQLTKSFEDLPFENEHPFFCAKYNRENLVLAYSLAREAFSQIDIIDLKKLSQPKGRFEVIKQCKRLFIIDYAHTPDALEKLLLAIREAFVKIPIWIVFGCGGDRDKGKRAQMGAIAQDLANYQILTSDNPRFEDPEKILDDIEMGCLSPTARIAERRKAIQFAYKNSSEGEVIAIAGKGHEDYQDINGEKIPFDDRKVVLELENSNDP